MQHPPKFDGLGYRAGKSDTAGKGTARGRVTNLLCDTYSCIITRVSTSLVILGCGERKKLTSRPLQAIDRYDGPVFRVFRKHAREDPTSVVDVRILSARFGLIRGNFPIPRYDLAISPANRRLLRRRVEKQLKSALASVRPDRLFVSVGQDYWPLLETTLTHEIVPAQLSVATGGIGGRASQLAHWLRTVNDREPVIITGRGCGEATLLGTTVQLSAVDVLRIAAKELPAARVAAKRFETWYVPVGNDRVAPKWLVSLIFDKPVSRFRTADARRVLSLLGVDCIYASNY
jgi:hypothetical protein